MSNAEQPEDKVAPPMPAGKGILLDDPEAVIDVRRGFVDVFATTPGRAGMPGALHHVLRVEAGLPLTGAVPLPAGIESFVVIPGPDSRMRRGLRKDWLARRRDADVEEVVELLTDAVWESAEAQSGAGEDAFPAAPTRLEPGKTVQCLAGEALACDFGMIKVNITAGSFVMPGADGLSLEEGDRIFLTKHNWLVAVADDAALEVVAIADIERLPRALTAYTTYQRAHILAASQRLLARELAAPERMRRRVRGVVREIDIGLFEMQRLLHPDASDSAAPAALDRGLIVAAAREVGRRQGITFSDAGELPESDNAACVQALAQISGVRVRSVTLSGRWWEQDSGPLLAFREQDELPLALYRGRGGKYVARDPQSGTETVVDEPFAASLKAFAHAFYRPFPHEPISVPGLVVFGLSGQGRDIRNVLILAVLIGMVTMVMPVATAEIIDWVIPSADASVMLQLGLVLVAVAVVHCLFNAAQEFLLLRVSVRMEHDIQAAVWDRVLAMPIDFFKEYPVGDLAMRVNAINMLYSMLSVHTLKGLLDGVFVLMGFGVLFSFSPTLAFLGLGLIVGAIGFLILFGKWTMHALHHVIAPTRRIMGLVFELIQGVAKLRTTAAEARAFGIWSGNFARFRAIRLTILRLEAQQKLFFDIYHYVGLLLVFVVMGVLLSNPGGGISAGKFVGFFAAFSMMYMGVIHICHKIIGLYLVVPMYTMAKPILEGLPETAQGRADPGVLSGGIELNQVSFTYPDGDPVLDDVSFTIPPGSFTAIVGPSGSGKSTLLRMMLGFEVPNSGAVLYDDKNLQDLDQRALRRQFGVVLQNSPLIAGDIFSNIVGVSGGNIDDAWAAARLAGLEEDIQALPMGMHTAIAEGSSTLSGGQRQRILIARSLVGKPRVLFLDEATSALDNRSQALVSESLLRLKATRVVIAHRLSTIEQADQIIVLDGGEVVQIGTYDELLEEEDGLFAQLARRQMLEGDAVEE